VIGRRPDRSELGRRIEDMLVAAFVAAWLTRLLLRGWRFSR
jgi:hypothetical protein